MISLQRRCNVIPRPPHPLFLFLSLFIHSFIYSVSGDIYKYIYRTEHGVEHSHSTGSVHVYVDFRDELTAAKGHTEDESEKLIFSSRIKIIFF